MYHVEPNGPDFQSTMPLPQLQDNASVIHNSVDFNRNGFSAEDQAKLMSYNRSIDGQYLNEMLEASNREEAFMFKAYMDESPRLGPTSAYDLPSTQNASNNNLGTQINNIGMKLT